MNHPLGQKATTRNMNMAANLTLGTSLIVAGLLLAACTIETNSEAEAKAAKIVIDDFWNAISAQDVDLLSRAVAHDEKLVVFGTDAAERWIGSSAFLSAEEQMMQVFDVVSLNRREETFQMNSRGAVAWFSTVFDLEIDVDGEVTSLRGLRTTGVLEKRNDAWVVVQAHTSVPVAGQAIEY
jgi:ketosteroid isomerase-like protein